MHTAFYGRTRSGKTFAAQQVAKAWVKNGGACLVLDHKRQPWPSRWVFSDPASFLAAAKASENCLLVIDEGWNVFTSRREDLENQWLANESRHQGHTLIMGSQRPNQVLPSVRACFDQAFCFSLLLKDAKEVCSDFGFEPSLALRINALPRTVCLKLKHFEEPKEKIFSFSP